MRRINRPLLARAIPAVIAPRIFDPYTASLFALIGIKQLLSSYIGPLMLVRRASDSATMYVGFQSDGSINIAPVITWAAGSTVTVQILFDQSGAGNNFQAPSNAEEPRIVLAGVYDTAVWFDGSNDNLQCVNSCTSTAAKSIFQYLAIRSYNGISYEYGDGSTIGSSSANAEAIQEYNFSTTSRQQFIGNTVASSYANAVQSDVSSGHLGAVFTPTAGASYVNSIKAYRNGALVANSGSSTNVGSGNATASFPSAKWRVGGRTGGAQSLAENGAYWSFYEADKSVDALAITALS